MRILLVLLLSVAFSGCQSVPPAPEDRFYRLMPNGERLAVPARLKAAPMTVRPLRADSLYGERAIVFSPADRPRELQQYHYHHWLYAPPELVQGHLAESLRRADGGLTVATVGARNGHVISGRLLRLDRQLGSGGGAAVAEMELALAREDRALLMDKVYRAEVPLAGDSVSAHVAAMEQALAQIYADFLLDVEKLK